MSTPNTQANPKDLLKSSLSSLASMQPSDVIDSSSNVNSQQMSSNVNAEYDPLKPNANKQAVAAQEAPKASVTVGVSSEPVAAQNKSLSGRFSKPTVQPAKITPNAVQSAPVKASPTPVVASAVEKVAEPTRNVFSEGNKPTSIRQMARANVAKKEASNVASAEAQQSNVAALSSLSSGQVTQGVQQTSQVKQGRFAKVAKPALAPVSQNTELPKESPANIAQINQQTESANNATSVAQTVAQATSGIRPENNAVAHGRFGNKATTSPQSASGAAPVNTTVAKTKSPATPSQVATASQVNPAGGLRGLKEAAAKKEEQSMITGTDVRIKLNTMRTYSPLIDVIKKHDPLMSDEEFESVFSMLEQEVDKLTTNLCEINGIDRYDESLQWAVASVKKTAVEHVSNQWKGNRNAAKFSMDGYLDAYKIALDLDAVSHEVEVYPRTTFETKIKLSMMKALTPVVYEYSLFENVVGSMHPEFKLNREELCDKTSDWLMESALSLCEDLNVDPMDENMVTVFQSALNVCGENLSSSVASVGDRTLDKLERMEPAARIAFIQNSVDKSLSLIDMDALKVDFQEKIDIVKIKTNKAPLFFATNRRAGIGR